MEKIGFIGLGIMGKPMSKHLLKAGYPVTVLATSKSSADLKEAGATVAVGIRELMEKSDVIITMLPDSPEVEALVFGSDGVLKHARNGMLFIDMSTIAPAATLKIFEALSKVGVQSLDAPVSGGQAGAEGATLSIMIGGKPDAVERAMPIFACLGKNIVHIGDPGAGQVTKACNQVIVGMAIEGVAEALTLARKSGIDVAKVRQALLGGFAASKVLDVHGQRVIERNFKPGFRIKLHRKDMTIALEAAKEKGVAMPAASVVASQMDEAIATQGGDIDHSGLALVIERLSGL